MTEEERTRRIRYLLAITKAQLSLSDDWENRVRWELVKLELSDLAIITPEEVIAGVKQLIAEEGVKPVMEGEEK